MKQKSMNAQRLLALYDRVADAPKAVPRLRRFVLDLAVRGKLVEQDPDDEPASELLERIEAEKARLVKIGRIGNKAVMANVEDVDEPHALPRNWWWVRFGDIVDFSAGRTPSRNDTTFWNTGDYPWISIADMEDGKTVDATKETVSEKARKVTFKLSPQPPGTMIMSFKLTIGKIARLGKPAYHNEAIISIRPHLAELDPYLFKVLPDLARSGDTKGAIKGATLNRESISNILVPLPPLAEQHRIVAKVDELMELLDELEATRSSREATRDRLTASSFARLTAPDTSPYDFSSHAHFALNVLPKLSARPDQIKSLRQTILNLAVRGKLVEQDPNDEPAEDLLKRIAGEKVRLVKSGATRRTVSFADIDGNELPFDVPRAWAWTRLQSLCISITDGDHQPPPRSESGVPFLVIGNVRTKKIEYSTERTVPTSYFETLDPAKRPRSGDILYTLVGSFGIPVLVLTDDPFCVQRHIGILRPASMLSSQLLALFLESQFIFRQAERSATGIAQKTVPLSGLRSIVVPVPPLAEQHRIVAKVDQLMELCDRLETSLSTADTSRQRLLEALLHEALNKATPNEEVA